MSGVVLPLFSSRVQTSPPLGRQEEGVLASTQSALPKHTAWAE